MLGSLTLSITALSLHPAHSSEAKRGSPCEQYSEVAGQALSSKSGQGILGELKLSSLIVVDQFGYPLRSQKVAVIRRPEVGFDAGNGLELESEFALINVGTNQPVLVS